MGRQKRRPGDVKRWFAGGTPRAVELGLRTGERHLLGYPLAVGRQLMAFERWDGEALVPIAVDLVPLSMIEGARVASARTADVDRLPDLATRRGFFGASRWLRGVSLDGRAAALESLARLDRFVSLEVHENEHLSTLRGRVRRARRGVLVFEWVENGQDASSTLCLVRLAHVVRVAFGSAACELAAARPRKASPAFDSLAESFAASLETPAGARQRALLDGALVGQEVELELDAPERRVTGRLVAVGEQWFAIESHSPDGALRLDCHALADVQQVEVTTPEPIEPDRAAAERLPPLDELPAALRAAQRLWGGVRLEILADGPTGLLAEVLEVGRSGIFLRPVDGGCDPETLGHVWVDLAAVLSFGQPTASELAVLRRPAS